MKTKGKLQMLAVQESNKIFAGEALPNTIEFLVPSTYNVNERDQHNFGETLERVIAHRMAQLFGGATAIPVQGYYIADNGTLVSENITIVRASASDKAFTRDALTEFRYLAQLVCSVMRQESVAVIVNGQMYFVK